jgi:STE24 endopeptidase
VQLPAIRPIRFAALSATLVLLAATHVAARESAVSPPATAAAPAAASETTASGPAFDPVAATDAYLATVAGEKRARSDAYFEGGYWLQLWDFLLGVAVNLALLATGVSRRLRDLAVRATRFRPVQTALYWALYLVLTTVVLFPMAVYEGFFREHQYGLSNQHFGDWFGDQLKGLAVGLVLGAIAVTAIYAVVRRFPRTWAVGGAVTAIAFVIFVIMISPVYVAPLFNAYTRLADPVVSPSIVRMARAQGVPAEDVWVFDASRQTKRVSANVSGLGATMRISLNDNLLNRCSLAEIEAVMGHEIGHYVLHHIYKTALFLTLVIGVGFAFLRKAFDAVAAKKGAAWGITEPADPAGLPLALTLLAVYLFVLTPVLNTWTRVEEAEADLFGINASGQPDGEAEGDLKLGEYRKLDPSPLEEMLFFDHPSGRSRILMAMKWKAEHADEAARNAAHAAADDARRGWSPASAAEWSRQHEPK